MKVIRVGGELDANSDLAASNAAQEASDLGLHLRVVGGLLEEHGIYRVPRLEAVKNAVLRIFRELAPAQLDLRRIREILCYEDVPLVKEEVLRQALNSLEREDSAIRVVAKSPKQYVLAVEVARPLDQMSVLIEKCWKQHFSSCRAATLGHFQRCVALLFARYGCAAHEALTSSAASTVRLDGILDEVGLPAVERSEFANCFSDFILSPGADEAALKMKLAGVYAFLRMNGAGNWGRDELKAFFDGRRFLLDTNVLFELMSRNVGQVDKMFRGLKGFGATFVVGSETRHEFETALRVGAGHVVELAGRGVDVLGLVNSHVVRTDWVKALFADYGAPTVKQIQNRVDGLLKQVDSLLADVGVEVVYLERGPDTAERADRIERVQKLALEFRNVEKHADVARHDALLWESVEGESRLADMILTLDRSLVRVGGGGGGQRAVIMLDEVVAYSMLGGVGEDGLVDLFGHALSRDLYPDGEFFSMQDLKTIAVVEANLLTGPPRALRRAAAQLAEERARRVNSGEPVSGDEIGRILFSSIAMYKDDRIAAQRERDAAVIARELAEAEREKRLLAEREANSAKLRMEQMEQEGEEQAAAVSKRLEALEADLRSLHGERAKLQADLAEKNRRQELEAKEEVRRVEATRKRRDWMLFVAIAAGLAAVLFGTGVVWGASVAALVAIASAVWAALAQETPSVSLPLLALAVSAVVAAAGIVEKWPQARAFLGIPSPSATAGTSAPSPTSIDAPPTKESGEVRELGAEDRAVPREAVSPEERSSPPKSSGQSGMKP